MYDKHLLIKKAFVYTKPKEKPQLRGYYFLNSLGYWVDKDEVPYVLDTRRPKPQTKKADVETGEDQKGE
ncbi:hypothetical protein [Peribacillus sp. Hz7]|uniref:hypothetical protein n=1 Tax=Peribacillus sp. Hz7 TaxID=3344873 RepID=UPI0035CBA038